MASHTKRDSGVPYSAPRLDEPRGTRNLCVQKKKKRPRDAKRLKVLPNKGKLFAQTLRQPARTDALRYRRYDAGALACTVTRATRRIGSGVPSSATAPASPAASVSILPRQDASRSMYCSM